MTTRPGVWWGVWDVNVECSLSTYLPRRGKVPSILIIWSEWIQSVLLDVNECFSTALTAEPYSNIPWGLGGSDGTGWEICAEAEIWDVEYSYFSGHPFLLKESHLNPRLPLHSCSICMWFYQCLPKTKQCCSGRSLSHTMISATLRFLSFFYHIATLFLTFAFFFAAFWSVSVSWNHSTRVNVVSHSGWECQLNV